MIVRRTESSSLLWGRRQRRSGRGDHPRAAGAAAVQTAPAAWESSPRARRQGGPSEDQALYACGCGYVFAALVSTSVDCPACGDTQAW
jgi:hypothetical protein